MSKQICLSLPKIKKKNNVQTIKKKTFYMQTATNIKLLNLVNKGLTRLFLYI